MKTSCVASAMVRRVDAALALGGAGPAAAARVCSLGHPGGAGAAADRRVAVIDKRVDEDVIGDDVVVDLLLGPLDDRVDLDHLAPGIPLDDLGVAAGLCLLAAHSGEPRVVGAEGLLERHHLAQVAAEVRITAVQARAKLGVLLGHRGGRRHVDDVHGIDGGHGVPGAHGLREVVAGVQEQHVNPRQVLGDKVDQHGVGHRRGNADPAAERPHGPRDHLVGRGPR